MSEIDRYEINGHRLYKRRDEPESMYRPSVTSILGYWVPPRLKNWFIKTSKEDIEAKKEATAKKGSDAHEDYEKQGKGDIPMSERLSRVLGQSKVVRSEFLVVSDIFGYGGQIDAELDTGEVIDYKTGRFISKSAAYQLAAYRYAYFEESGKMGGMKIFHMPADTPDGTRDKVIPYKDPAFWFSCFVGLLPGWRSENYWELKKINWKWLETDFLGEWMKLREEAK